MLAGCGEGQPTPASPASQPASTAPASKPTPAASRSPGASASVATQSAQLFFEADGKLVPEQTQVSTASPLRQSLEQLLRGPKDTAHFTEIPKSSQLLDVSLANGTATVSLDHAFFGPGGATAALVRVGQVVYTATQFPDVRSVQLLDEGKPPGPIGEGLSVNRPLTRQDFSQVA